MATTIKISRSANIEESREIALIRLDKYIEHHPGQPVEVRYYTENHKVDSIFVIGVSDGYGRECYSIIASRGEVVVNDVLYVLADISQLVNGGRYIVQHEGVWYLEMLGDNGEVRSIVPLSEISSVSIYKNLKDGYNWYWRDGILKREDEFPNAEELDQKIRDIVNENSYIQFSVRYDGEPIFMPSEVIDSPRFIISFTAGIHSCIPEAEIHVSSTLHEEESIKSLEDGILTLYGRFTENVIFTFSAEYLGTVYTQKVEFRFLVEGRYAALSDGDNPEEAFYRKVYFDPPCGAKVTYSLNDERSLFIVPENIVFSEILDENGLNYIHDYTLRSVNGYNYYLKNSSTTIDNFKQQFKI